MLNVLTKYSSFSRGSSLLAGGRGLRRQCKRGATLSNRAPVRRTSTARPTFNSKQSARDRAYFNKRCLCHGSGSQNRTNYLSTSQHTTPTIYLFGRAKINPPPQRIILVGHHAFLDKRRRPPTVCSPGPPEEHLPVPRSHLFLEAQLLPPRLLPPALVEDRVSKVAHPDRLSSVVLLRWERFRSIKPVQLVRTTTARTDRSTGRLHLNARQYRPPLLQRFARLLVV